MQTITAEQIRAARALLDWKQSDLAAKTGLSLPSINNIERMIGSPRISTLQTIQNALQSAGIQFIGNNGVQKYSEFFQMTEHQGDDFIARLYDDFLPSMKSKDDEAIMYGLDDSMFTKYAPEPMLRYYYHQLETGFQERILARENDNFFLSPVHCYRWISTDLLGKIPYLVYHDRLVMIMWETKRVVIIRSQSIADTFRAQFEFLWAMAKPVPSNSKNKLDDPTYRRKFEKKKK